MPGFILDMHGLGTNFAISAGGIETVNRASSKFAENINCRALNQRSKILSERRCCYFCSPETATSVVALNI
jgi:hypothetical protein